MRTSRGALVGAALFAVAGCSKGAPSGATTDPSETARRLAALETCRQEFAALAQNDAGDSAKDPRRGARSAATADARAVLAVDGSIRHALAIAALAVLRREGFSKISFAVTSVTTGADGAR